MIRWLVLALLLASPALAQQPYQNPIVFAWDASAGATGYRLAIDGVTPVDTGAALTLTAVLSPGAHTATVSAYNGALDSGPSLPLAFTVGQVTDPACTPPLGNRAVSVFVTALQKTGSGGAGSMARLDFQVGSPNSPVTRVAVRTLGADLRAMTGTDLTALAGMWVPTPSAAGTYPLSVLATNAYGCTREVTTSHALRVP